MLVDILLCILERTMTQAKRMTTDIGPKMRSTMFVANSAEREKTTKDEPNTTALLVRCSAY